MPLGQQRPIQPRPNRGHRLSLHGFLCPAWARIPAGRLRRSFPLGDRTFLNGNRVLLLRLLFFRSFLPECYFGHGNLPRLLGDLRHDFLLGRLAQSRRLPLELHLALPPDPLVALPHFVAQFLVGQVGIWQQKERVEHHVGLGIEAQPAPGNAHFKGVELCSQCPSGLYGHEFCRLLALHAPPQIGGAVGWTQPDGMPQGLLGAAQENF